MPIRRALVLRVLFAAATLATSACIAVTDVEPDPAEAGEEITIEGLGFGAAQEAGDEVVYGGSVLPVTSWADTEIVTAVPPDQAVGSYPLSVRVNGILSPAFTHRVNDTFTLGTPALVPNPRNILSATIEFSTSLYATPEVEVHSPDGSWTVPASGIRSPVPHADHEVMILGLRLGQPYTFTVRATRDGETVTDSSLSYTPGPYPADVVVPPIQVLNSNPAEMEPGVTLFADSRGQGPAGVLLTSTIWAVDAGGEVLWYYRVPVDGAADVQRLANGNISIVAQGTIFEVDMLGSVVKSWTGPPMGHTAFHHFSHEMASGNFLSLSTELRYIGPYPDGNTYPVVADLLVEFTHAGQLAGSWSLFDLLDPFRVPDQGSFDSTFYDAVYHVQGTKDLTHGNSIVHDPSDDSMIVSVNHQDIVIKVSRATGQLVWVLGSDLPSSSGDDDWPFLTLVGGGELPNHQHEVDLLPNGHLMLYDNGTKRPTERKSRAVEYAIDEAQMQVTQVWEWFDPDYSPPLLNVVGGDADLLPGGTVLVANSGQFMNYPFGPRWAQFAEVRKSDNTKVWEMVIKDPNLIESHTGFNAARLPSLYP